MAAHAMIGEERMLWLVKEEPDHYSFDDLGRDGSTLWSGVKNPLAQRHLRAIRKGETILYYHTGKVKAIVGIARALSGPRPDPDDRSGRRVAVEIGAVRPLPRPVPLAEIKKERALAGFPLVRISRLSVMPVSDREWTAIDTLARTSR
jgi:predicted RNA-binding protein with PUA-like domain